MSDFDLLVDRLRTSWAEMERQPEVVTAALEAEVADFKGRRALIEQAKGVLMQLLGIDADQAFGVLARYSQTHQVKVWMLAERLVQAAVDTTTPSRHQDGLHDLLRRLASE